MSEIELKVRGKTFDGWETVDLKQSLEALAVEFSLGYTERWTQAQAVAMSMMGGDPVELLCDGKRVTVGYVCEDGVDYDKETHSLNVVCASKTVDLVECSAVYKTGSWTNADLLKIARDLCQPFGINASTVVSTTNLGAKFTSFSIQDGETAFECLDRAARMRGVKLLTDSNGDLQIGRTAATKITKVVLERGVNLLRGSRRTDMRQRFSQYTLKTQVSKTADSDFSAHSLKATATDADVTRYRPLIIMAEAQSTGSALRTRVNWERNTRAGRSKRYTCAVQGWKHGTELWAPNRLIRVKDEVARANGQLLILSVRLTKSLEAGEVAELELGDSRAVDPEPYTEKPNKALDWLGE
jgi:prophage tail gpP-like protein